MVILTCEDERSKLLLLEKFPVPVEMEKRLDNFQPHA
jgi:hypothetical protein